MVASRLDGPSLEVKTVRQQLTFGTEVPWLKWYEGSDFVCGMVHSIRALLAHRSPGSGSFSDCLAPVFAVAPGGHLGRGLIRPG